MGVKVSTRALEARMKRHLEKEGLILRKSKADSRWHQDLGDYYTVDAALNEVKEKHFALEAKAREAGVLKPFEEVADS